ncbi:hypothetical protein VB773_02805 [Haloarculaceae archaeon H-GB2-1]|nr:hypothetical protein [Haloarculaceae archaeon H-GB1-1]MEA5388564.1 hypothetical protein [Haloarculaceae archaeon H-GB11]MEA5406618.1 hypothetical protein [Haloarculaceae archaeon H-GB2-1]
MSKHTQPSARSTADQPPLYLPGTAGDSTEPGRVGQVLTNLFRRRGRRLVDDQQSR